tara:strand:- start:648 stop:1082 length:435 start_codon:yes stop_codon:yes gene_type:complete
MSNIVDKVFDNTEDGKPNYAIQMVDGTRLYCRGQVLNPIPQSGDAIDYTVINVKTSDKGNQYTNVKNVSIAHNHTLDDQLPTEVPQTMAPPVSNGLNRNDIQRMDIFVTGVVGRSMGSGHFSVQDISELTKNAKKAFYDNLKNI